MQNFKYGAEVTLTSTKPILIDQVTYENDSDTQDSQSFTATKSAQLGQSWTVTKGVQIQQQISFSIPVPLKFGSSTSTTLSFSEQNTKSETLTQSYGGTTNINVPPHSRVEAQLILDEAEYSIPFSGYYLIRGNVDAVVAWAVTSFYQENAYPMPIGGLFRTYPHPNVEVIDENTIRCAVAGDYRVVQGNEWRIVKHQYPLNGAGDEPDSTEEVLLVNFFPH